MSREMANPSRSSIAILWCQNFTDIPELATLFEKIYKKFGASGNAGAACNHPHIVSNVEMSKVAACFRPAAAAAAAGIMEAICRICFTRWGHKKWRGAQSKKKATLTDDRGCSIV